MNNDIKRGVGVAATLLGCLVLAVSAQAASFDCGKARIKVEHLICDDPEISRLDSKLSVVYKAALHDEKEADSTKQSQRQWLKERNNCEDAACVKQAYEKRVHELLLLLQLSKSKPRFTVSHGKGWTVCESYARYLNSLPESTPLPLCHIPRYPDFADLKEPDWEVLDISSNLELVYKLEKLTSPSYHDRPVDSFDHWKTVYEQQIKDGTASPRLRRTHLALLNSGPVETILAYEPDQDKCDKEMAKNGYADRGALTKLFLWNEQKKMILEAKSQIAFSIAYELLLFQGKPLLFFPYWGVGIYPHLTGGISVDHFIATGEGTPYGHLRRCVIGFDLTPTVIERMTK